MLEVILDTETTGLSTAENHKIVEIGCVELSNQIPTSKIFHQFIKMTINTLKVITGPLAYCLPSQRSLRKF